MSSKKKRTNGNKKKKGLAKGLIGDLLGKILPGPIGKIAKYLPLSAAPQHRRAVTPMKASSNASGVALNRPQAFQRSDPEVHSKPGGVTIKHRERIMGLDSSTEFSLTTVQTNPGLKTVFAYLGSQAPLYTSYRFRELAFTFTPQESAIMPGKVWMAFDYDPLASPPVNQTQMSSYPGAVTENVYHQLAWRANPKDLHRYNNFLVRSENVDVGVEDIRLYDVGTLLFSITGTNDSDEPVGELWCEYTIELEQTRLDNEMAQSTLAGGLVYGGGQTAVPGSLPRQNAIMGAFPVVDVNAYGLSVTPGTQDPGQPFQGPAKINMTVPGTYFLFQLWAMVSNEPDEWPDFFELNAEFTGQGLAEPPEAPLQLFWVADPSIGAVNPGYYAPRLGAGVGENWYAYTIFAVTIPPGYTFSCQPQINEELGPDNSMFQSLQIWARCPEFTFSSDISLLTAMARGARASRIPACMEKKQNFVPPCYGLGLPAKPCKTFAHKTIKVPSRMLSAKASTSQGKNNEKQKKGEKSSFVLVCESEPPTGETIEVKQLTPAEMEHRRYLARVRYEEDRCRERGLASKPFHCPDCQQGEPRCTCAAKRQYGLLPRLPGVDVHSGAKTSV
jgi:hypothetical protein